MYLILYLERVEKAVNTCGGLVMGYLKVGSSVLIHRLLAKADHFMQMYQLETLGRLS
jgi:gluconate kinase